MIKQKNSAIPKGLKLVSEKKSEPGKTEILFNPKTKQYMWRIISRNGYTVCSATGLNSRNSCVKGMKATLKILNETIG